MSMFNQNNAYTGSKIKMLRSKAIEFLKEQGLTDHPVVFEAENSSFRYDSEIEISLHSIPQSSIEALLSMLEQDDTSIGKSNYLKAKRYANIVAAYKTKVPKNLPDFADALREFIKNECFSFSLKCEESGVTLFRRVVCVEYQPSNPQTGMPAEVSVRLSYVRLNKLEHNYIEFHTEDLTKDATIEQLLADRGYLPMEKDDYDAYMKRYQQYKALYVQVGKQYQPTFNGFVRAYKDYYASKKLKVTTSTPLVIDSEEEEQKVLVAIDSTQYFNTDKHDGEALTFHAYNDCYLKLFSMEDRESIALCSDLITPYKWNDNVLKDIVIPQNHRDCIDILMNARTSDFGDVVSNKSKGIIVLASGVPGTGKTLSAQCWAEAMHKPLYVVQAAELGISVDTIEKNIRKIFDRIIRWDAVLCLDEVDAFVHRRDTDLQQNAIVGVFLRMLETFSGILFMTTNRFKDRDGQLFIDDAIVSRVSAHIVYELPDQESISKILEIQARKMNLTVEDNAGISKFLFEKKCSGRDIRNFVKLAKMFLAKESRSNLTLADIQKVLPFHATLSINE